jgi:hypothetical protein
MYFVPFVVKCSVVGAFLPSQAVNHQAHIGSDQGAVFGGLLPQFCPRFIGMYFGEIISTCRCQQLLQAAAWRRHRKRVFEMCFS